MNRLPEILQEVSQLQQQGGSLDVARQEVVEKLRALTDEWQNLCSHPNEYIDTLEKDNIEYTKCSACNKILSEEGAE